LNWNAVLPKLLLQINNIVVYRASKESAKHFNWLDSYLISTIIASYSYLPYHYSNQRWSSSNQSKMSQGWSMNYSESNSYISFEKLLTVDFWGYCWSVERNCSYQTYT
jgi:hypothetical protein